MLTISGTQMEALAADARAQLRSTLRRHWHATMPGSVEAVGEAECERLLAETQELADDEASLGLDDLILIADLQLVALANERGGAAHRPLR